MEHVKKKLVWDFDKSNELLAWKGVATVCEESRCPNRYECSQAGVATFLIGGSTCTRACRFCHIDTGKGEPFSQLKEREEEQIVQAALERNSSYVVITAVARDDAESELAHHFSDITQRLIDHGIEVELLIPDFHGRPQHLDVVGASGAIVMAHNIETVERLSKAIRPQARYDRSMQVYDWFHENYPELVLKAGLMVGLGETKDELGELFTDLRNHNVDIVTIGQYMRPSPGQAPVEKIYSEEEFEEIEQMVADHGFLAWEVGPYVRSSYMAARTMDKVRQAYSNRAVHAGNRE